MNYREYFFAESTDRLVQLVNFKIACQWLSAISFILLRVLLRSEAMVFLNDEAGAGVGTVSWLVSRQQYKLSFATSSTAVITSISEDRLVR